MITEDEATVAVLSLAGLPFFPAEEPARAMIADLLMRMCRTGGELQWLVRRVFDLWKKWEGPRELRATYCAKFKPQDGIEAISGLFPDGIVPPEKPALPAFQPLALPPGATVSADPILDATVLRIGEITDINHLPEMSPYERRAAHRFDQILEDIEVGPEDREAVSLERKPPVPVEYITPADIERAVAAKPDRRDELVQQALKTLADPKATWGQKQMAYEVLRGFGVTP